MPLDRTHITVASRVMLPTYVVFFGVIGTNFAATGTPRLFNSPMLRYADQIMSIRAWGGVFLACSAIMLAALIAHNRYAYRYGLMVCCLSMATWTTVAIIGVFYEPVSYSAWAWPALATAACWASNKSLAQGEQDRRREN